MVFYENLIGNHEKDKLWVGMTRETAHQLGTPISSLLGWIDLLKEIRIISGINSRSNSICYKSSVEFNLINKMIDKFKDKYSLEGFKK